MNTCLERHVLIVDDTPEDHFLTRRALEKIGFPPRFVTAQSAVEAMALLKRKPESIGLAFLDLRMPQMNGLELLTWIRARSEFAHIKVIMLSGADEPREIETARQNGADGYLVKYPVPEKLAAILSSIVPDFAQHTAQP